MPTWIPEGCDHFGWVNGASNAASVATLSGYTVNGGAGIISATGPYGEPALYFPGESEMWRNFTATYQEVHASFHYKFNGFGSPYFFRLYDLDTMQIGLQAVSPGTLRIVRNGAVLLDVINMFQPATWYFLQVRIKIANAGGVVVVRKNNAEVASYSGDTQETANAYATRYYLSQSPWPPMAPTFANLAMYSDVASWPLKEGRYHYGLPDAAGTYTQFAPLASTNVSNVDEARPDGVTTYNSSTLVGNKDAFGTNLAIPSNKEILMVMEDTWARKSDAGARTLRNLLRIGGADYEGADKTLTPDFLRHTDIRSVSPATGVAWTPAELNALEKGYKDQA